MDFAFSLSSKQALHSQKGGGGNRKGQMGSVSDGFCIHLKCPTPENYALLIFFNFFLKHFRDNAMIFNRKRKYRFNDRSECFGLNDLKPVDFFTKNRGGLCGRPVLIFVKPPLCIEIQCEKAVNKSEMAFLRRREGGRGERGAEGREREALVWLLGNGEGRRVGSQLNHSLMATLKKTHKIRKLFAASECPVLDHPDNDTNVEPSPDDREELDRPYKDEAPIKRSIKIDPRQISNLPQEQRLRIKTEHPEMNEYFCMSARDKSKFFHLLNQKYRQEIKLPEPPGSAPMKKTIRFKKRFEIKPFGYLQKCELVRNRKSFMELYRAKDDSKSKRLSKFPKNN